MARRDRLTPSLFDRLVAEIDSDLPDGQQTPSIEISRLQQGFLSVSALERFSDTALRQTLRRDLGWLLNTMCHEKEDNLSAFPRIRQSVLNYGVVPFAGRSASDRTIAAQARSIRDAIRVYEPRIDPTTVRVVARHDNGRANHSDCAVRFVIEGDIKSAGELLPVRYEAEVDLNSGLVDILE